MATHHVSLRRACPALLGVDCIARRARLNKLWLKRSAPRPKYASAFTRGNDLPRNPRNTILRLVRCKVPTDPFSHKRANQAKRMGYSAEASTHLTARPEGTAACGGLKPYPVKYRSRRLSSIFTSGFRRPRMLKASTSSSRHHSRPYANPPRTLRIVIYIASRTLDRYPSAAIIL